MYKIIIRNEQILLVAREQRTIKGGQTLIIPKYHKVQGDVLMAAYSSLRRAASEYLEAVIHKSEVVQWAALQS